MKPRELDEIIELPSVFAEVWEWFIRLNSARQSGFGISGIPYTEMQAFFVLNDIKPELWELLILEKIDRIFVNLSIEKSEKETNK